ELTVACHKSSTPAAPLSAGGLTRGLGLGRSGHFHVPAVMLANVACRCGASSVPSEPNDIAEKLTCCHQATSLVQSRSPVPLPDEDGTSFLRPGRKSVAQQYVEMSESVLAIALVSCTKGVGHGGPKSGRRFGSTLSGGMSGVDEKSGTVASWSPTTACSVGSFVKPSVIRM